VLCLRLERQKKSAINDLLILVVAQIDVMEPRYGAIVNRLVVLAIGQIGRLPFDITRRITRMSFAILACLPSMLLDCGDPIGFLASSLLRNLRFFKRSTGFRGLCLSLRYLGGVRCIVGRTLQVLGVRKALSVFFIRLTRSFVLLGLMRGDCSSPARINRELRDNAHSEHQNDCQY
jgi:hypothetical protein